MKAEHQPEEESFVKRIVSYLREIDDMIVGLINIPIINEDIIEHIEQTWNDEVARQVHVRLMNTVVEQISDIKQPYDREINPFCVYQELYVGVEDLCEGCFYYVDNGSCMRKDSLWGIVRSKLHSTISEVLDYKRLLMVLWLGI